MVLADRERHHLIQVQLTGAVELHQGRIDRAESKPLAHHARGHAESGADLLGREAALLGEPPERLELIGRVWVIERANERQRRGLAGSVCVYGRVEDVMAQEKADVATFLTEDELVARYRGLVAAGTLRNWRNKGVGPPFVKIGKGVLYAMASLEAWERQNTIPCDCAGISEARAASKSNDKTG